MELPFFRYVILIIATLCCSSILANMNIYNFTKICPEPIDQDQSEANFTKMSSPFTRLEETVLQSASAIGALLSSIPYLIVFNNFSGRYSFVSAGAISIVSTAVVPVAYSLGFWGFLAARIVQGVAFSTTFLVIGMVTADWAPLGEHGIFLAFLTGCTQLSNIFTMPVSGAICSNSSMGWPWVYYVHAIVCAVLFGLWFLIYRDTPSVHACVASSELERIKRGKLEKKSIRDPVPYRQVLKDVPILTNWLSAFADLLYVQLVAQYEPIYFNDYLEYNIFSSGFLSAVPVIAQFAAKLLSGVSSDMLSCVSATVNVKIFNTLALIVSGVFMIGLAFVPNSQQLLCVISITVALCFTGFNTAGFNKCTTLRSRQHAHFTMSQIMNIWSFCILIEPFIVEPILVDQKSESQWLIVFCIHGGFAIVAGVIFLFTADARPALWTEEKDEFETSSLSDSKDTECIDKLSITERF